MNDSEPHVVIIGAGFCGLAAAFELVTQGIRVTVLEQDRDVGGLAGSFDVAGVQLEKFYHHWFTNDVHIMQLIDELRLHDRLLLRPTRTGVYYANNFFNLSTPLDLMRFKPLSILNRIRLGLLALRARRVSRWQELESLTAAQWLKSLGGDEVYRVVWQPLLQGKFGTAAEDISAVWFWNKLKLRGGSRGKGGEEQLAYFQGGFSALAMRMVDFIEKHGGTVRTHTPAKRIQMENGNVCGVVIDGETVNADAVIATPALPIIADLIKFCVSEDYLQSLKRIRYLANICMVLELDRRLSETYWLNVNDPNFPFVGIIEHTNFEPRTTYGGKNIVYLSKYLPEDNRLFRMSAEEFFNYAVPYLQRMFPNFTQSWVLQYHLWRARYSQPVVERHYSRLVPDRCSPLPGLYLATMAQIYPEDRGTNYAVREGRRTAEVVVKALKSA